MASALFAVANLNDEVSTTLGCTLIMTTTPVVSVACSVGSAIPGSDCFSNRPNICKRRSSIWIALGWHTFPVPDKEMGAAGAAEDRRTERHRRLRRALLDLPGRPDAVMTEWQVAGAVAA